MFPKSINVIHFTDQCLIIAYTMHSLISYCLAVPDKFLTTIYILWLAIHFFHFAFTSLTCKACSKEVKEYGETVDYVGGGNCSQQ